MFDFIKKYECFSFVVSLSISDDSLCKKKKIEIKFTTKLFLFFFAFMFIWFYIEVSIISYKLAIRMAPNIFPLDIT